ncbi:MAG: DMT family transporter [Cyanobacteria bacterium J06555_3]
MNQDSLITPSSSQDPAEGHQAEKQVFSETISLIILAIAIVALAFSPILTKLSELELSPTATIFNRLWISTLIISIWQVTVPRIQSLKKLLVGEGTEVGLTPPIATWRSPKQTLSESISEPILTKSSLEYRTKGLLILASASATASALLWAVSFAQTSIASSTVLRSLTPLFISFGAWLILKQRFNRQFLLGMTLAIFGGIAIGWNDLQLGDERLLGDGIALLSAALHGANILTAGYLRERGCTTDRILLWRCGAGALMILPIVCLTKTQILPISPQGWLTVIALAVVCQTFGQGLLVFSLKQFSSSFVGVFALLKPIVTAFLAWIVFSEEVSISNAIALILILGGIYLAKSSDSSSPQ